MRASAAENFEGEENKQMELHLTQLFCDDSESIARRISSIVEDINAIIPLRVLGNQVTQFHLVACKTGWIR